MLFMNVDYALTEALVFITPQYLIHYLVIVGDRKSYNWIESSIKLKKYFFTILNLFTNLSLVGMQNDSSI